MRRRRGENLKNFLVFERVSGSLAEVLALPIPGAAIFVSWRVHLFSLPRSLMTASLGNG